MLVTSEVTYMAGRNAHPKYNQFRFDTGSLSLNFVATVRHRGGSQPRDLLSAPEALADALRHVHQLPVVRPRRKGKAWQVARQARPACDGRMTKVRPTKTFIDQTRFVKFIHSRLKAQGSGFKGMKNLKF